jgi:hypothetical protein
MPHLQEITVLKKWMPILFICLVIILSLTGFASCRQDTAPTSKIEILNHSMTVQKFGVSPDSVAVITGTAKNTSGYIIQKAMIEAIYFDENGKVIGTSTSSIDNLGPDILWNFNTQFTSPDAWKIVDHKLTVK